MNTNRHLCARPRRGSGPSPPPAELFASPNPRSADESGADGLDSRYYLLTLVLHEQDAPLGHILAPYERALADKEFPDIPFHASPLMNGHDRYEGLDAEYRLSQAADYACAVELAALKYQAREETATDRRFFGSWQAFKRNALKTVRKKAL